MTASLNSIKTDIDSEQSLKIEKTVLPQEITYIKEGYARGKSIPWFLKMAIKIILAILPVPYSFWKKLGLFQHGEINKELSHLVNSYCEHMQFYKGVKQSLPASCLELGPGDSVGHALSGYMLGLDTTYLVDAGDFASKDPKHYQELYSYIEENKDSEWKALRSLAENASSDNTRHNQVLHNFTREDVLDFSGGKYKTQGIHSMKEIENECIDFSFSNAVFEHIHADEFAPYMVELARVHKKGSIARHWVDLHDHLGGALNSMRFSERFWESFWVKNAGFYTNRLTMDEMITSAQKAGFSVEIPHVMKWHTLTPPRKNMHNDFAQKSEEELNICTFLMVLEKQ